MAVIDTNFQVHKISKTLANVITPSTVNLSTMYNESGLMLLGLPAQHPIQKTINCPFPSRIFHGRQNILAKMHQFFTQSLDHQHIYILHGLGGAGKTQIALKFIRESLSQYVQIRLPCRVHDRFNLSASHVYSSSTPPQLKQLTQA